MGNKVGTIPKMSLKESEIALLTKEFQMIKQESKTGLLGSFQKHFSFLQPKIAEKLYLWISGCEHEKEKGFTLLNFLMSIECLLNSFGSYIKLKKYQNWKTYEVLMEILGISGEKAGLSQCLELVCMMLQIIYPKTSLTGEEYEMAAQRILGSPTSEGVEVSELKYLFNSMYPSLNKILGSQLRSLFFNSDKLPESVSFDGVSNILASRWEVLLLPLIIPQISMNARLHKLYSTVSDGLSFLHIHSRLKYYKAPFFILLRHSDTQYHTLGVFNDGEVLDCAAFKSGKVANTIFSLSPELKVARASGGKGGTNYCYLKSRAVEKSETKQGLGFGGDFKRARLWIDGNFPHGCYLNSVDDTYETKQFLEAPELNVIALEIWGLGSEDILEEQKERFEMEEQLAKKEAKVNKKMLVEGNFAKEYMFANTFSHQKDNHGD